jgi:hypothetical protein
MNPQVGMPYATVGRNDAIAPIHMPTWAFVMLIVIAAVLAYTARKMKVSCR